VPADTVTVIDAIGQVLSFGVGVALSPIPIIGVILMLGTPRARPNGLAFIAGWVVGLAAAGTIVLLAAGGAGASDSGAPADWVSVVKLVLGVLLAIVAVRQWHARPRDRAEPELPGWMKTIDTFTPPKAAGMAVLLSAVNPKNLLLVVGAAAAIAQTGASTAGQAVALLVFVLLGTLGPGIPVAIYFLMRDRAAAVLEGMRRWMARENTTIMAVLCSVIGAKLVGDAISGLAS
jgi:threonine/homoserine/homoserine lactone efflux protein